MEDLSGKSLENEKKVHSVNRNQLEQNKDKIGKKKLEAGSDRSSPSGAVRRSTRRRSKNVLYKEFVSDEEVKDINKDIIINKVNMDKDKTADCLGPLKKRICKSATPIPETSLEKSSTTTLSSPKQCGDNMPFIDLTLQKAETKASSIETCPKEIENTNRVYINMSLEGRNIKIISDEKNCQNLYLTIDEIFTTLKNPNEMFRLKAIEACKKIVSKKRDPPINEIIVKKIVSICVEFLKPQYSSQLQYESCLALAHISCQTPEKTQYIIKQGAIPLIVKLLKSPSMNVVENAVKILKNITGDWPIARDLVLREGTLGLLIQLITPETPVSFVCNIVWTLSNMCKNKNPSPPFEIVKDALPLLNRLLGYSDKGVLGITCRALSYLTGGSSEKIQAVIECGVVPKLIKLLALTDANVLTPALQTVGNILTVDDLQIDTVIAHDGLRLFRNLLCHKEVNVVKETARIISRITAGNVKQIWHVIDAGFITQLICVISNKSNCKSQNEAAQSIRNIANGGSLLQIGCLMQKNVLKPFCDLLMSTDCECIKLVLEGMNHILIAAKEMREIDRVVRIIMEIKGLDKLENLQKNKKIETNKDLLARLICFLKNGTHSLN